MADGIRTPTDPTGPIVATDEVTRNAATEHQPVVKISLGAEGQFDTLVDSGPQLARDSIPVVLPSDATLMPATTNNISLSYTGKDLTTVVYLHDAMVLRTVTLTYTASILQNLSWTP